MSQSANANEKANLPRRNSQGGASAAGEQNPFREQAEAQNHELGEQAAAQSKEQAELEAARRRELEELAAAHAQEHSQKQAAERSEQFALDNVRKQELAEQGESHKKDLAGNATDSAASVRPENGGDIDGVKQRLDGLRRAASEPEENKTGADPGKPRGFR